MVGVRVESGPSLRRLIQCRARPGQVVHEVLHSLGLAHSDEAGSVMSPIVRITNVLGRAPARSEQRALPRPRFSPGDLATLDAMYPRAGCPVS